VSNPIWTSPYAPVEVGGAPFHEAVAVDTAAAEAQLEAHGFGAGDVLALQAPNSHDWVATAVAALRLGGAVTGVSLLATADEVERQLRDSGAALVATPAGMTAAPRPAKAPEGVALLPYSSGTSGLPKGVRITHANLITAIRQVSRGLRLTPDDVVLALAPFSHVMGFVITLGPALLAGAGLLPVPRFEPAGFLDVVARERVSVLIVPPPLMPLLARSPVDLPAVELIVSGGAPLGAGLQQAVAERFPGAAVGQGWGLTETTACGTMPDRELGTVPGSCGRLMPNTELRVGDDDELLMRGPQTMAGYLHRPAATAELIDADGWVHTGDAGRIDADGNVFIVDRLKELIKVNALQVAPAELEAVLGMHPAVAECAVVPRPDERCGEVPVAVVVARAEVEADELLTWVAARVAPHKRLRAVRFADAIPRTPAGKILRRLVRDSIARHGWRPSGSERRRTKARRNQYV
jgi:acyl-CoA synthetase (AMP-forming)/AMP-acid ligase II